MRAAASTAAPSRLSPSPRRRSSAPKPKPLRSAEARRHAARTAACHAGKRYRRQCHRASPK
eukprot:1253554-Prymnesium_polylepis.1